MERCSECVGAHDTTQRLEVCPVERIQPNPDYAETEEELLEKYNKLH